MVRLISILMFIHFFGMAVGWIALLSGDLWEDKSRYQQVLMLLSWEWWLALALIGE